MRRVIFEPYCFRVYTSYSLFFHTLSKPRPSVNKGGSTWDSWMAGTCTKCHEKCLSMTFRRLISDQLLDSLCYPFLYSISHLYSFFKIKFIPLFNLFCLFQSHIVYFVCFIYPVLNIRRTSITSSINGESQIESNEMFNSNFNRQHSWRSLEVIRAESDCLGKNGIMGMETSAGRPLRFCHYTENRQKSIWTIIRSVIKNKVVSFFVGEVRPSEPVATAVSELPCRIIIVKLECHISVRYPQNKCLFFWKRNGTMDLLVALLFATGVGCNLPPVLYADYAKLALHL